MNNTIYNYWTLIRKTIEYNLKIVFANKFIWFLLGAIVFYLGLTIVYVFSNSQSYYSANVANDFYGILTFCGILLIFYPTVFGIQNDQDAKTIEILFGIPNYRYKVWLIRLVIMFIIVFIMMILFAWSSSVLIAHFQFFDMAVQVMIPIIFLGTIAFMLSTVVRSGNGTAVVVVIVGLIFFFVGDAIEKSPWNVFHNPFSPAHNVNESAWALVTIKNRIIFICGSIICLLAALLNLQRREKYM